MLEAIDLATRDALAETAQDEALATYAPRIEKKDAVIDWTRSALQVERMTRAYDPWPVARTRFGGEEVLIWRAAVDESASVDKTPGLLFALPQPVVQCGSGALRLIEVQAPGRKRMSASDFFRGRRISPPAMLGT
jgi:methionyl-tRNA formyltransferase